MTTTTNTRPLDDKRRGRVGGTGATGPARATDARGIHRPRLTVLVSITLLAAAAAACSSTRPASHAGGPTPTSTGSNTTAFDPTFAAKVNSVCAAEVATHAAHPFPLKNFDPANPTPDQIRQVAAYFAAYGDAQGFDHKLHALGLPTNDTDAWQHLLALIDQDTANARAQQKAGAAGDISAWKKSLDPTRTLHRQITTAGSALGFTADTPCGTYYSD